MATVLLPTPSLRPAPPVPVLSTGGGVSPSDPGAAVIRAALELHRQLGPGLLAVVEGPVVGPVNVGNPHEITMLDQAQRVLAVAGIAVPVQVLPLPAGRLGDPNRRCPDVALLQSFSDWQPTVSLDDGLRRTIDWMRTRL